MVNLKSRVFNQPLLLEPQYAQTLYGALANKLDIQSLIVGGSKLDHEGLTTLARGYSNDRESKPYAVKNGNAMINVAGSLVAKSGYLDALSGMTSYESIKSDLDAAFADDDVAEITLLMNSSGGEVTGCFELADYIYKNRDTKPMTALVEGMACSAAYMLAAATSKIVAGETSITGSIGVVMAHTSVEKAMEKQGVKVTLITSGAHKADGNPYQDLPTRVLTKMQLDLKDIHEMFATRVATFRGITVEAVYATEASTYLGKSAIDIGLVDSVASHIDFKENLSHTSGTNINLESNVMADPKDQDNKTALANATAAGHKTGLAEGIKQGATDMQTRIKGILMCDDAEGKPAMASHLAFDTQLSVEDAGKMLAVAGVEVVVKADVEAAPVATPFEQHVAAETDNVGADLDNDADNAKLDVNSVEFALAAAKQLNG